MAIFARLRTVLLILLLLACIAGVAYYVLWFVNGYDSGDTSDTATFTPTDLVPVSDPVAIPQPDLVEEGLVESDYYSTAGIRDLEPSGVDPLALRGMEAPEAEESVAKQLNEIAEEQLLADDFALLEGDDFLETDVGAVPRGEPVDLVPDPGQVVAFLIEGIPTMVERSIALSFDVLPVDENGTVVPDFIGQVLFDSSDHGAVFPSEYFFDGSGDGGVNFDSALALDTVGIQDLSVVSTDDPLIRGNIVFEVVPNKAPIEILLPKPGTYPDLQMVIRGEADPGVDTVRIFDGQRIIAGEVNVAKDGSFFFSTGVLAPGKHEFRVISLSNAKVASETVEVVIKR